MFSEISQNSQENVCARVSFLMSLSALLKKRLWHRCFLENFVKFKRTPPSDCFCFSNFLLLARAIETEEKDLLEEIDLMKSIGFHKNIINIVGASTMMKPLFLVLEYMCHGDLLHYLRKKRADVSFHKVLFKILFY